MSVPNSIPRPLVRMNQWFIVISVLVALISQIHWILLIPLLVGISGLFLHFNPVMQIGKRMLRKPFSTYIPEDREQQQFNQWIAVVCLVIGMIGFALNWILVGYIFSIMVLLAALVAICGFCIGCFIRFQLLKFKQRRFVHRR